MLLTLLSNKKISPMTRVIRYEDYACVAEAKTIIEDAKNKAKRVVQQANMQADMILEDAKKTYESEKERGFQEGSAEGQKKQIKMIFHMLSGGVNYVSKLEQALVNVIQETLEKIFGEMTNSERILALVKTAVKSLPKGQFLKIHVHPEQTAALKTNIEALLEAQPNLERIEVESNNSMQLDQCIMETETGILDASLDVQFNNLMQAIQSALH